LLCIPTIDYMTMIVIFCIAMIGYNGSIIFYDAFIVDVCDDERVDVGRCDGAAELRGSLYKFVEHSFL